MFHDPDGKRGPLPSPDERRADLAAARKALDTMYAHRAAKLARYSLDEDALFADAERDLLAATSWARYDAVIYALVGKFHDDHLTYHPPHTAAPSRGYDSYRLGLTTVLAGDALLVQTSDLPGVAAGDAVVAIDGRGTADVLAGEVRSRVWSRAESARYAFAHTWTSVLYAKGDPPRDRSIAVEPRDGSGRREVAIHPRLAEKQHHERAAMRKDGDVAIVEIHSLSGGKDQAAKIDQVLHEAASAHAIVLDLRGDHGGIDHVGFRIVADLAEGKASLGSYRVLAAPETLALRPMWKHLVAGADGYTEPQPLTVDAQAAGAGFHGKVAVLIDAGCASTCEVVAAALRADVAAVLVGETTAGSSGAPVETALPASKGKLSIPTWDLIAADGHAIESDGVVPDLSVPFTPDALARGEDPQLTAALAQVRP